jgi:hypothetical protein
LRGDPGSTAIVTDVVGKGYVISPFGTVVNPKTWLVAQISLDTTDTIQTTSDAGATWEEFRPIGLPAVDRLDFVTPQAGWARPSGYECVGAGQTCSYGQDLMVTVDGGRHWTTIDLKAAALPG